MQGRKIPDPCGNLCEPGDYYKDSVGDWRGQTPNGLYMWLRRHHIIEHADGTITVPLQNLNNGANSILVSNGSENKSWHGWIDHGEWKEC